MPYALLVLSVLNVLTVKKCCSVNRCGTGVLEVFAAESKLQTTVCSVRSNQGHEWNLQAQGKTLKLVSTGIS